MPLPFTGNPIGVPFIELQSVDSTNNYAMRLIRNTRLPEGQNAVQHGTSVFAHEQTAGKGQRNKSWISERDSNIALTVILNPYPLVLTEQFYLSACIAVAVREFFANYSGDEPRIKWPNDLYWRDRKAGGVLIESIVGNSGLGVSGQQQAMGSGWQWTIVGIGININQTIFPAELPNPVSLKQITGKNFDPLLLAKELCSILEKKFELLRNGGKEELLNQYQHQLYKKDEKVKLRKGNRIFETTIKGVSRSGELITYHTAEERFDFGEVEWII